MALAPPIVSFDHAVIARGGVPLIRELSVAAREGDLVAIVGPNGSGKSTLLLTVLGEILVAGGTLRFPASGDRRPRIALIPQTDTIDPLLPFSVDEILLAARFGGKRPRKPAREGALGAVGLPGIRRRLFSSLSGGERQRVLLARATLADASLWMFDEPTAAVDRAGESMLLDHVRRLVTERGVAALFVSHHLEAVRPRADSVVELTGGRATVTAHARSGASV